MPKQLPDTTTPLPAFQAYQKQFTQHIRDPKNQPRPANVPAKRMAIYTEIVYNNIEGTLASCFPVTKKILSARQWQQLMRGFMANYQASTPFFREIPAQFLQHFDSVKLNESKLPAFLPNLMHYEWVELALSVQAAPADLERIDSATDDLLLKPIVITPNLFLLQYDYPVHLISPNYQPKQKTAQPTYLLVFRHLEQQIKFMELNPITFQLVALLQNESLTGQHALTKLANAHPQISAEVMMQFGAATLAELKENGVILGVKKALF